MSVTERLARAAVAHPWRIVAAWAAAGVAAIALAAAGLGGGGLTTEARVTNDPQSVQAKDLLDEFRGYSRPSDVIVVRSSGGVEDPAVREAVGRLVAVVREEGAQATSYYEDRDPALRSADGRAVLIPVRMGDQAEDRAERIEAVVDAVEAADGRDGLSVAITGTATAEHDSNELAEQDLRSGELGFGLPAALIVLLLVFGAVVGALLPIFMAFVSIVISLGLTGLAALGFEISFFIVNMITAVGLALGIDYVLFVISRFREERSGGRAVPDAIAAAGATASRAILFSGVTFVVAMVGMLLVPNNIMRSLALGAIFAAVASVAAALTLLPAVLALLGDRINAVRIPLAGRALDRPAGQRSPMWEAVVRTVMRHPGVSLVLCTALLVAAAVPLLGMNIGSAGASTFPEDTESRRGLAALEAAFPSQGAEPAIVVVEGERTRPAVQGATERVKRRVAEDPAFGDPEATVVHDGGDLAFFSVPVRGDALEEPATEAVERLREDYIPAEFGGAPGRALVAGVTSENIDYYDVQRRWLPIVIAVVLALSFLMLTLAFRSVVVSAKAMVLNLLSVGAAYGLLVLVFQEGVGADLLGFQQVEQIEAWVPTFLFAILFGLSMDYQVFLLSRIRERYSQTGDNTDAVAFGIGSTARLITGAALIIVVVFIGFASGELVMFQQMGFGVAVALLIDATLVRSVLVPAAMKLLGKRNWYLPRWLQWLPRVGVEGPASPTPARPR